MKNLGNKKLTLKDIKLNIQDKNLVELEDFKSELPETIQNKAKKIISLPTRVLKIPDYYNKKSNGENLSNLHDSIKTHGLVKPVIINKRRGDGFYIVDGVEIIKILTKEGITKVPCVLLKDDIVNEQRIYKQLVVHYKNLQLKTAKELLSLIKKDNPDYHKERREKVQMKKNLNDPSRTPSRRVTHSTEKDEVYMDLIVKIKKATKLKTFSEIIIHALQYYVKNENL